jgi:hypothetical protein
MATCATQKGLGQLLQDDTETFGRASHHTVASSHNFGINGHQLRFLDKNKREVLLDFLTTPGDTRATGKSWLLLQFVACNICLSVSQRQSGISNFCPLQFKRFNSFMLVCRKTFGTLRQPPHLGLIYIRLPLLKSSRSEDLIVTLVLTCNQA